MRASLMILLLASSAAAAGDWSFTDAELEKLASGEVLVSASVAGGTAHSEIRAAVQIQASPETIFGVMKDCAQALEYVPHLEHCALLESAADGSWQVFEQRIDYSWYLPHAYYVFRAEYEPFTRIRTSHIRGDFRENRGVWELRPVPESSATIVTYEVHVVPRFFVPRWMMRNALRRDLPEMLKGLRTRSEIKQASLTGTPPASAVPESAHPAE